MMATPETLQGTELIDCAKANGKYGIEITADRSGYGTDIQKFEAELKQACDHIGINYTSFDHFLSPSPKSQEDVGEIVAPDTPGQL